MTKICKRAQNNEHTVTLPLRLAWATELPTCSTFKAANVLFEENNHAPFFCKMNTRHALADALYISDENHVYFLNAYYPSSSSPTVSHDFSKEGGEEAITAFPSSKCQLYFVQVVPAVRLLDIGWPDKFSGAPQPVIDRFQDNQYAIGISLEGVHSAFLLLSFMLIECFCVLRFFSLKFIIKFICVVSTQFSS